jgi:hypothetical protein
VTLVLTLVLSTVALTALFWALAVFLQAYLYNQPADQLPLRALCGGLAVGCFLTAWVYLNTRQVSHTDQFGVVFGFDHMMVATSIRDVDEFEAVRRLRVQDEKRQPKEATVPFKWQSGATGGGRFVESGTGKDFRTNTSDYMTVAVLVPEGDGGKARFEAAMKDGTYAREGDYVRFAEQGGSRFIDSDPRDGPRLMQVPSAGGLAAAVGVNVLHYVVWFLVFWLALRFTFGHALGLTAIFATASMLVLMPLLFRLNEPKPVPLTQQQQPATAPK